MEEHLTYSEAKVIADTMALNGQAYTIFKHASIASHEKVPEGWRGFLALPDTVEYRRMTGYNALFHVVPPYSS